MSLHYFTGGCVVAKHRACIAILKDSGAKRWKRSMGQYVKARIPRGQRLGIAVSTSAAHRSNAYMAHTLVQGANTADTASERYGMR